MTAENVPAIQINGEWYEVPSLRRGAEFTAEQCDSCGCTGYKVIDRTHAECVGDRLRGDGCHDRYLIEIRHESEVIFP